jgi:hypothetical protein
MAAFGKDFDGGPGLCRFLWLMRSLARILLNAFLIGAAFCGPTALPTRADAGEPDVDHGYLRLGFDRLASYKFSAPAFDPAADPKTPPPTGEEQIPAEVKAWNGKKVIVTGFMLPTKLANGRVTEFLLVKSPMMCCYGVVPNMNEWVVVKMANGVPALMDVPISFYGELKVGAMFENGYMTGIYQLEGEKMGDVKG